MMKRYKNIYQEVNRVKVSKLWTVWEPLFWTPAQRKQNQGLGQSPGPTADRAVVDTLMDFPRGAECECVVFVSLNYHN